MLRLRLAARRVLSLGTRASGRDGGGGLRLGRPCLPALALLLGSVPPGGATGRDLTRLCLETAARGVFTAELLEANHRLAAAVTSALCTIDYRTHVQLNDVGFGYGERVLGQLLTHPLEGVRGIDGVAAGRWRRAHCPEGGAAGEPWSPDHRIWEEAYALVDEDRIWPWRACRIYHRNRVTPRARALDCVALGLLAEGSVTFEVRYRSDTVLDRSARLRSDLEVEGARCPEIWRAGSKITAAGRRVTCRWPGEESVRFRVAAKKLSCEAAFPPVPAALEAAP